MNCIFLRRGYGTSDNTMSDTFSQNSWETIITACQNNAVPDTWAVGDSKLMAIGDTNYSITIIGKKHDSYTSGGTAPLTFQLRDCYNTMYRYTPSGKIWATSEMRVTTLPNIFAQMPSGVQTAIKEVNKTTYDGSSTVVTLAEKLFLLSEIEITGSASYSASGEGSRYAYYTNGGSTIKNVNGSAYFWWTRSPAVSGTQAVAIRNNGQPQRLSVIMTMGVSFAFCF